MKKRKYLSLLAAVLLGLVLALSCCFLFACNREEAEEPEVPGVENPEDKSDDEEKKDDDTEEKEDDTETKESTIDQRVYAATKEGDHDYLTFDADSNIYFEDSVISVEASSGGEGTVNYKITGTAGVMDENQAEAFWSGVAKEGDAYISYKIFVKEGESITYTDVYRGEETLTNSEDAEAAYFDNDYFYVIERISGVDQDGNPLSGEGMTYTISDGEEATEHVISIDVTIPKENNTTIKGFTVPVAGSESATLGTSYAAGGIIEENELFTLSATVEMKYSYGGGYGYIQHTNANSTPNRVVSFTNMSGETINPDQGIVMSNDILPTNSESEVGSNYQGEISNVMSLTAKTNIRIYVSLTFANSSYNSDRSGEIYYAIDGTATSLEAITQRNQVRVIDISLNGGDVLVIGAKNTDSDSSHNARVWLFGAEAIAL